MFLILRYQIVINLRYMTVVDLRYTFSPVHALNVSQFYDLLNTL